MNASLESRRAASDALTSAPLDLLVIGGGIVGAGIARDAAMRGLRTGLVDRHDFAFGTSGRSSRLLHGGLRYLAQGRLGLVREASVEKKILHQIAPHLAAPLPFLFPTYRGNPDWKSWQLGIGVKLYDLLCGGRNLGPSTRLNRQEVLRKVPGLSTVGLNGAVRYYDGFTNDARLTLDTLRSAAQHGAWLLNYCPLRDARPGEVWDCDLEDLSANKCFVVRTRAVVNATGPWADGLQHSQVKLRLTKGIHLVVSRDRLPVPEAVVMTEGKRILFAIPWGERTILGTTDTDFHGSPERVFTEPSDQQYVLQVTNRFFPSAKLAERDVISSWAGVRPLIANPNGSPSEVSRSHQIRNPQPGWWDVAGGKLTTYRRMAEQTVDHIVQALKQKAAPCRTATEPLLPAAESPGESGVMPPAFTREVVQRVCAHEWALHLEDVMVRRTGWHYYFAAAAARAEQVADWMGQALGWPETVRREEIARYGAAVGCKCGTKNSSSQEMPPPNAPDISPVA